MCSSVARVRVEGAWQWLTPVAQRREEKLAGERTYCVPHRICDQGVGPEGDAAYGLGLSLSEATADGLKIPEILGFEGSALRESLGDAAEEFHLFNDRLCLQLPFTQPGKLSLRVGCEESRKTQRPSTQVRVAEKIHACRIAPSSRQT